MTRPPTELVSDARLTTLIQMREARMAWPRAVTSAFLDITRCLRELADLRREVEGLRRFHASVSEALNSGGGTYRP